MQTRIELAIVRGYRPISNPTEVLLQEHTYETDEYGSEEPFPTPRDIAAGSHEACLAAQRLLSMPGRLDA